MARYGLGNLFDVVGTKLGLPEFGLSEKIAGQATVGTGIAPSSYAQGNRLSSVGQNYTTGLNPNIPTLQGKLINTQSGGSGGGGSAPSRPFIPSAAEGSTKEEISAWEEQQRNSADNLARIDLENAMAEYDRQAELGQNQIGSLEKEEASTLSEIGTMRGRTEKEALTAKTDAESSTQRERGKALSTAQDVTKQNRNVLRALGILSSSAAGEMLTKPMNQFSEQSAELGQALVKRKSQVDDWLMQRQQDFDSMTQKVKDQYMTLVNNIRTDLRYNGEMRANAVKAAGAALQQKLADIAGQAMQYRMAARDYNNQILSQIAQIQLYQNPNADVSGILSSMLNGGEQRPQGQTAQIYQGQDPRKRNLLSG